MGNICASGYYKAPAATEALFLGGVFHSGELAVWRPDNAIQIFDRAKDIIILGQFTITPLILGYTANVAGGENISSVALESVIVTHP